MAKITVDGTPLEVPDGSMLLPALLDRGLQIPHYCYHPKLSIDGSCRMCMVKIEGVPKLAISCNTPVRDGMVVDTQGAEVVDARHGVLELLLVNHPLDCPICDQAGECYLQDYGFEYGTREGRSTGAAQSSNILFTSDRTNAAFTLTIPPRSLVGSRRSAPRARISPLCESYSSRTRETRPYDRV